VSDVNIEKCPVHRLSRAYDPFHSPQLDNPFPVWAESRSEAPVFYSEVLDAWIVTRYKDIAYIYRTPSLFSSELDNRLTKYPPAAQAILDEIPDFEDTKAPRNDAPNHTRLRRYMQMAFLPKKLALLRDDVAVIANRLIDEMEKSDEGDFYVEFARPFSLNVMGLILDLPDDVLAHVQKWTEADMLTRHGHPTEEQAIEGAKAVRSFWDLAVKLLEERKKNPGNDFVSLAVQANDQVDDPLSLREMVGQVVQVFLGGFETTGSWLTMAMALLLENDRQRWLDLRNDPTSIERVVEETLRLRGPTQINWRTPLQDVEIDGVTVPAGSRLGVAMGSANRDEEFFVDADSYDLSRPNLKNHLAFGTGIHVCVGAGVSRLEGRVAFAVLSQRLADIRLAPNADVVHYLPNAMQIMPRNLHVRWDMIG
jgi:cytochrome P450